MKGINCVYGSCARFLFDTGALHLFVSAMFAKSLGLKHDNMKCPLVVTTPASNSVLVRSICLKYTAEIVGHTHSSSFIVLDMSEYEMNIEMDWLSHLKAKVDCFRKRVIFQKSKGWKYEVLHRL